MEEAATTQAAWITPLKHGPLAILEEVLNQTGHAGPTELDLEQVPDSLTTMQRFHDNLVVDRVGGVERRKAIYVARIEATDPFLDELFW
jgi:hypothetical protein